MNLTVTFFASAVDQDLSDILSVRADFSVSFEEVRQAKPEEFKDVIRRYKKRNEDGFCSMLLVCVLPGLFLLLTGSQAFLVGI